MSSEYCQTVLIYLLHEPLQRYDKNALFWQSGLLKWYQSLPCNSDQKIIFFLKRSKGCLRSLWRWLSANGQWVRTTAFFCLAKMHFSTKWNPETTVTGQKVKIFENGHKYIYNTTIRLPEAQEDHFCKTNFSLNWLR